LPRQRAVQTACLSHRCKKCTGGLYYENGHCHSCPEIGLRVAIWVPGVAVLCTLVWLLYLLWRMPHRAPQRLLPVSHALRSLARGLKPLNLRPKFKVAMAFYQVVSVLDSTYSVRMPPSYTRWMNVFDVIGFKWEDLLIPDGCLTSGFVGKLLTTALGPLAAIAMAFLLSVAAASKRAGKESVGRALMRGLLNATPFALLVTFCFVPSVSASIFASWSCEPYGSVDAVAIMDATEREETIEYLRKDLGVVCHDSDEHKRILTVAYVLMVLWPIGVWVLYAVLSYEIRRPILAHMPTPLSRATRFLHQARR
jgi:hypothetical protein